MIYKRILLLTGIFFLFLFIVLPISTPAATDSILVTPASTQVSWPNSPMGTALTTDSLFHDFIKYLYEWGVSLGGIAVFIMLLIAGIQYLTSAGDPGKMGAAVTRIRSAILGLVLLLTSWLILNTISPQFVQMNKLPSIWNEAGFAGITMMDPNRSVPPCDVVVVFPEVNFEGIPEKSIKFPETKEIIRIEGDNLNNYSKPLWSSAINLIELDANDHKLIKEKRFNQPRLNEKGEEKDDGEYKQGGACMIDLFYTTRKWWGGSNDPCGGRLARIQLPSRDITEAKFQDQSITCAEVRRTLPVSTDEEEEDEEEFRQIGNIFFR